MKNFFREHWGVVGGWTGFVAQITLVHVNQFLATLVGLATLGLTVTKWASAIRSYQRKQYNSENPFDK